MHPRSFMTVAGIASIGLALAPTSPASARGGECFCVGDLNGSQTIDGADLTIVLGDWGTFFSAADLSNNGVVDGADITVLLGNWGPCPGPANDLCANAENLGYPVEAVFKFCFGYANTDGPPLPPSSCGLATQIHRDVWYEFHPLSDGLLTASTCPGHTWWDSVIAIYGAGIPGIAPCPTEGPGLALLIGCSDDSPNTFGCDQHDADISVEVSAGFIYKIRVGSRQPNQADESLLYFDFHQPGFDCDFPIVASNAQSIAEVVGTTVDNEVGDVPNTCFGSQPQGPTEWIRYTANCNGSLVITTCHPSTDFDTVLTVFVDSNLQNVCGETYLGCNDDSQAPGCLLNGLNRKSRVEVDVTNGQKILIAVSGYGGASGDYGLAITRVCD